MSTTTKLVQFSITQGMIANNTLAVSCAIDHEANKFNQPLYRIHLSDTESVVVRVGDTHMVWGTRLHNGCTPEYFAAFTRLQEFVKSNGNRVTLKVERA